MMSVLRYALMATAPTPPALVISDETKQKFAAMLELIVASQSMNNEERQYWINILPVMTPEQLKTLEEILMNEKTQLAAIDAKYKKQPDAAAAAVAHEEYREKRRTKREEIESKEKEQQALEAHTEDDVLKQIQDL